MQEKRLEEINQELDDDRIDELKLRIPVREQQQKPIKKKRKLLSFEQEEEEEDTTVKIKKDTKLRSERGGLQTSKSENLEELLRVQYFREMERLKQELVEIQYSYWDGPNVIKKIRRKKKDTVLDILQFCRLELIENFQNVASVDPKELLLVIKDFIAPLEMSLAHIQILKLQTAKDDLLLNLRHVKIKKDGKQMTLSVNLDGPARIIQRSRYEKNKANYPFCNWRTLNIRS